MINRIITFLPLSIKTLFFSVLFIISVKGYNQEVDYCHTDFKSHIKYLASEKLKGRYPGTEGDSLAAYYIFSEFKKAGLDLNKYDGLQKFTVTAGIEPGENNVLSINGNHYSIFEDFIPVSFSANSELSAEVVFAGYGFSINTDDFIWDDYKDIDLKGKWVMILRGDPEPDVADSPFAQVAGDRDKVFLAQDKGAAGVILVSGEKFDQQDNIRIINTNQGRVRIPVIHIKRTVADKILFKSGKTINSIENQIINDRKAVSFNSGTSVKAITDLNINEVVTYNVVASLIVNKKNDYIVIGAHYDHLGMGGEGSSSRRPLEHAIHYGADDNASGVAALIEIAKILQMNKQNLNYNYIFVAFGAEEKGLLGSKFFVENPPVPINSIISMINLDMIGRMKDDNSLQIGGVGTAEEFKNILNKKNLKYDLKLIKSYEGYGPSDHAPFYASDIPVLFFSTGAHLDYHTPKDSEDRINYNGMKMAVSYIFDVIKSIDNKNQKLNFQEAGPRHAQAQRHGGGGVTLGLMPDFAANNIDGLRVEIVSPERPAYNAGMKNGDIIKAINGNKVSDIHEYMYRLQQLNAGDVISVDIERDNEEIVLIIQL